MQKANVIYEDTINYLRSIETELTEHFNQLQNNNPVDFAEDHPMAQSIQHLDQLINAINPTNPDISRTTPHCPFCFIAMDISTSYVNEVDGDQIIQKCHCKACDCNVQIVQFI